MYLLSSVAEAANDQLEPHYAAVFDLVMRSLQDTNIAICEYAIKAMTALVPNLTSAHGPAFQGLLPLIIQVVTKCIAEDNVDLVSTCMELLHHIIDSRAGQPGRCFEHRARPPRASSV